MANQEMKDLQDSAQDAVLDEVVGTPEIPTLETLKESHNPEDAAAAFFKMHESTFPKQVHNLTLNQAHRVILNTCFGGLSDKEYKLVSENERSVAYKFNEIVTQRFVMQMALEMQRAEEAHKEEQKLATPQGETDGKVETT